MEKVEILNRKGVKKGYTIFRNDILKGEEYCLVVHIWIKNKNGEYFVQQRSKTKKVDPYLWSIVAGFVSEGENSLEAAIREIKEEIGVNINQEDLHFAKRLFPRPNFQNIADVYIAELDINKDDIKIDNVEVSDFDFWDKKKLKTMKENGIFKDFNELYKDYFKMVFIKK